MEHQFNYMEHQFNVQLAKEYGIEEAILIHNMFFWINKNAVNNKHLYDGHYWTYNTQKALSDLFPYIHETKIQRSLKFLCECDFLIKGNFNKNKLDRTCWYAFSDKAISILQNEGYDISKMKNANYQNEATIPYSKHTDSNTYKKEDTNVSKKVLFYPTEEEKSVFEEFRKKYPGAKRGLKTELDLLVKKHKDWHDVIPILNKAIDAENRKRKEAKDADSFYPNPKNLQTYINNRSWELFTDEPDYDENEYHPNTNGSDVRWNEPSQRYICFYPWAFDNLCDGYTKDTRPDNATVFCQGRKYVWNKEQQKWDHG